MNNIGKQIRELRKEKKLTQQQLSDVLCVNRSLIAQYESDLTTPSCENLVKLAIFFETSTDFILGLEDESGRKITKNF